MMHRLLLPLMSAGLLAQAPAAPSPKIPMAPVVAPDLKTVPVSVEKVPPVRTGPQDHRGRFAGTSVATASTYATGTPAVPRLPADLLAFDVTADGRHFAATCSWKAEFAAHGFTFVPFLGSDSTESAALQVAPAQVVAGGLDVALHRGEPVRTDRRIELDRGGCVERFDLTPAGVEQSFVFAALPGRGELVLDLAVATALRCEHAEHGVRFVGARGGVAVTDAVAIDANGRRCVLPITIEDGGLRLRVPATFVADAALPLIVDPAYTPLLFWTSPQVDSQPDIAFLPSLGEYLVVWQHDFAATDHDVWALRFTSSMQGNANFFPVDVTFESWDEPRIASCALAGNYLVVAAASNGSVSPFWIAGRTWWQQTAALGPAFVVEAAGVPGHLAGDKLRPDVGGDPASIGPVYYTVVWERVWSATDHDIHMKQVTPSGVLRSAAPTLLENSSANESRPRIAKSDGPGPSFTTQHWPVVWQRTHSTVDEDVYGGVVSWDGQILVPARPLAITADQEWDPCVSSPTLESGGGRQHLVAWAVADWNYGWDVVVSLCEHTGVQHANEWLAYAEGDLPERLRPQVRPAVDCDGSRFAVAYSEYSMANASWDTWVSLCAHDPVRDAMIVQESRVPLGTSNFIDDHVAIAAQGAAGGSPTAFGIVYESKDPVGDYGLVAQAYAGHANLPLPTTRATACGGLGIALGEVPSLGATLHFTQTDQGPLTGFLFGFPQSVPLGVCPGCVVGVDGWAVPNPYAFAVPMSPVFVGLSLSCQAWSFLGGPCLGSVGMSDTIDLQLL